MVNRSDGNTQNRKQMVREKVKVIIIFNSLSNNIKSFYFAIDILSLFSFYLPSVLDI